MSQKVPHVHVKLIKAWAEGATIQRYNKTLQQWRDCDSTMLDWNPVAAYRVKPEPKPDVVRFVCLDKDSTNKVTARSNYFSDFAHKCDNLMVVFDGETGELKNCQVLAKE